MNAPAGAIQDDHGMPGLDLGTLTPHSQTRRLPAHMCLVKTAANTKEFGSWLLWPNWCLEVYPGGNLTVFHHVPISPEQTIQRTEWYFPTSVPTAADQEIIDFVHEVRLEDIPICESVQTGLHSLGYRQGRFVVDADRTEISEHAVHDFQAKVIDALQAAS